MMRRTNTDELQQRNRLGTVSRIPADTWRLYNVDATSPLYNRHVSAGKDKINQFAQSDQCLCCLITKTCLYNIDPLKPHFYIVKLGFTGVYIIILIFA